MSAGSGVRLAGHPVLPRGQSVAAQRPRRRSGQMPTCPVCGSTWLSPTRSGTARPHARYDAEAPSWDKVRLLRKEIRALQDELDRALEHLEPD